MITHSEIEEVRTALGEIDELTNLLDVPEDPKNPNPLVPSHSYVAVKIRKIIQKLLLVGFGDVSKMREALVDVTNIGESFIHGESSDPYDIQIGKDLRKIAADALASPARVCDKFGTDNVAAHVAYEDLCAKSETKESAADAIAWLLSIDQDKASNGNK